jgi:hypothetical protein
MQHGKIDTQTENFGEGDTVVALVSLVVFGIFLSVIIQLRGKLKVKS